MGLFDKKKSDDFNSPVERIDLSSVTAPTAASSATAAGRSQHAPAPAHHPVEPEQPRYGINQAIELMRTLPQDNVVYEYHSYPPSATGDNGYTWPNIPVIVGEYGPGGDLSFADAFHADVEAKQIPNLAWTLSAYSNCAPDLVKVTFDPSLQATAWGATVKSYLLAH